MRLKAPIVAGALIAATIPGAALAHTGLGPADGLASGFVHPFLGLDHLAAMVAVGVWAARSEGRAVFLLPAAFLVTMIAGAALGFDGVGLPAAEAALAASVVVLGVLIALDVKIPAAAAAALVAAFALFHGHAHGAEMAPGASAFGYAAGFVAATALLHGCGIAIGRSIPGRAARFGGAAIAAIGVVLAGV